MVRFFTQDTSFDIKGKLLLRKWIKTVITAYKSVQGEISIIFCSDSYLLEINKKYLGHDYYTDIITFDYCEQNRISGDLFISVDTVKANAEFYNVAFHDELHRVIIHGVLHLLKEDDMTPTQQQQMRVAEERTLAILADMQSQEAK